MKVRLVNPNGSRLNSGQVSSYSCAVSLSSCVNRVTRPASSKNVRWYSSRSASVEGAAARDGLLTLGGVNGVEGIVSTVGGVSSSSLSKSVDRAAARGLLTLGGAFGVERTVSTVGDGSSLTSVKLGGSSICGATTSAC